MIKIARTMLAPALALARATSLTACNETTSDDSTSTVDSSARSESTSDTGSDGDSNASSGIHVDTDVIAETEGTQLTYGWSAKGTQAVFIDGASGGEMCANRPVSVQVDVDGKPTGMAADSDVLSCSTTKTRTLDSRGTDKMTLTSGDHAVNMKLAYCGSGGKVEHVTKSKTVHVD